jgi:hypothetical protein
MKWSKAVGRTATNLDWSKEGFMTPLRFAPGDGWYYGAAVDWAGQALEKVTGKPLSAYMQEHLFDPLGMHKTTFWPDRLPHVEPETCAYMYRGQDGRVAKGSPPIPVKEHEMESGGAGLFTTAGDYAVFMAALLGGRLLREETMDRMFGAQLDEAQSAALRFIAYHVGAKDALAPEFPVDLPLNHGLGGVMNVEDVPEKRRAGSLMWSGMCNSRWVRPFSFTSSSLPIPPSPSVSYTHASILLFLFIFSLSVTGTRKGARLTLETVDRSPERRRSRFDDQCSATWGQCRGEAVGRAREGGLCQARMKKCRMKSAPSF